MDKSENNINDEKITIDDNSINSENKMNDDNNINVENRTNDENGISNPGADHIEDDNNKENAAGTDAECAPSESNSAGATDNAPAAGTATTEDKENEDILTVIAEDTEDPERKGFNKGVLIGAIAALSGVLIIGVIIAFFVFRMNPRMRSYKNTSPSAEESADNSVHLDMDKIESKLEVLEEIVNKQYLFDVDEDQIEEGIYKGYMSGLGDKYSAYYSAEEFEKLSNSMEGVFYGIGATVQKDPDTNLVSVVSVIENSPAEKAGVKAGDIIYAVDGEEIGDVDLDTLVYDMIRGEKGTDVNITFYRDGEKLDLSITRGEVANPTVYSEVLDGNIGYIEVSQFTDETVQQFKDAVDDMVNSKVKGLVIDLRNNGGGVLHGAVEMADYLIPEGVKEHEGLIVYTANRDGVGERYYATDGHQVNIPIVLLVNENSASAAEVFTGALMDYDWADVVGTQTFGKGIVQSVMPLTDGSAVKMTVEHYYTPDGTDLHGEGLTPDYEIEFDNDCKTYTDEKDNQYAKAVEIINSKTK